MALTAMEALVQQQHEKHTTTSRRKTQLLVTMGSPASGKSYLCWGPGTASGGSIPKRKSAQDGLILRTVDSFFGQFHRLSQKSSSRHHHYALTLSFVQLNQKIPATSSDACELHDLLQSNRHSSGGGGLSVGRLSPHVKALVPSRWTTSKGSSDEGADTQHLHLQQDRQTKDFHLANGIVHTCRTMQEARETLQEALSNSRKHSNKKRHQSHLLVQMQPVILEKSKASSGVLYRGGKIAVLDMAGFFDENATQRRSRSKDSLPNQSDAHTALMHCLQSIQYNEQLRLGKTPLSDVMEDVDDEGTRMSEMTCSVTTAAAPPREGLTRQQSFKPVPYPRHKLTMLLQPFFSPTFTDETTVTLILAASPGTRDYGEKKGLLQELECFCYPRMMPSQSATTGLAQSHKLPEHHHEARAPVVKTDMGRENHHGNRTPSKAESHLSKPSSSARKHRHKPKTHSRMGSDADDEASEPEPQLPRTKGLVPSPTPRKVLPGVFCDRKRGSAITPVVETAHSMAYSDTTDDEDSYSLPPPVAPPRPMRQPSPSARYLHSPSASAPPEKEVFGMPTDDDEDGIPGPPPSMVPPLGPVERYASTNTSTTAMTSGSSDSNTSSMTSSSTAYFRPVQHTLKKVMHVGKKQCGKVWDKMAAATGTDSTTTTPGGHGLPPDEGPSVEARYAVDLADLQRRLTDCEQERDALHAKVQHLEEENNQLRAPTSRDHATVIRKKADPPMRTEVDEMRDKHEHAREVESPYRNFGGVQIPTLTSTVKPDSPVYDRAYTGQRAIRKDGSAGIPQKLSAQDSRDDDMDARADESPYHPSFGGVEIPTLPGARKDSPIHDRAYTGRRARGGGEVSPPHTRTPPTAPVAAPEHTDNTFDVRGEESPYRSFARVPIPTLPGVEPAIPVYDRVPTGRSSSVRARGNGNGSSSLKAHMAKLQQTAASSSSPHFSAVSGSHHTSASAPWNKW